MDQTVYEYDFRDGGNILPHLVSGWSGAEPDRIWAVDANSQIRLPRLAISGAALCTLRIGAFIQLPARPLQRLSIIVNGINVGDFDIDRARPIRIVIPNNVLSRTEENIFDFYHPDGAKPRDISESFDHRVLSICFHRMEIRAWVPTEGSKIPLDQGQVFAWDGKQQNANPHVHLGCGWDERSTGNGAELWLIEARSDIVLPPLPSKVSGSVTLDLTPSLVSPYRTIQRLKVLLNGSEIGRYDLSERQKLAISIPPRILTENTPNRLVFEHPDCFIPHDIIGNSDRRRVSAFIHNISLELTQYNSEIVEPAISLKELFCRFESIGIDCEFGNVQRRAGAEPMGLFRWATTRIHNLVAGLSCRFSGLGDLEKIEVICQPDGKEYVICEHSYDLYYHTWQYEGQVNPEELKVREAKRLKFLARKFLEDIEAGEKILVYKHDPRVPDIEATALLTAVRKIGRNPILIVEATQISEKIGQIDAIGNGLFRGYIDHFTSAANPYDLSFDTWVKLCRNPCLVDLPTSVRPTSSEHGSSSEAGSGDIQARPSLTKLPEQSSAFSAPSASKRDTERGEPNGLVLNYEETKLMAKQEQAANAIAMARIAVGLRPEHAPALSRLGTLLIENGQVDEGRSVFFRAIELEPEDPAHLRELAHWLGRTGRTAEAVMYMTKAVDLAPSIAENNAILGHLLARNGDLQAAEGFLRRAVDLEPGNEQYHQDLDRNLAAQADYRTMALEGNIEKLRAIRADDGSKVLIGRDGWLFLDNDSNRTISQYQGRLLFTPEQIEQWRKELVWRHEFFTRMAIPYYFMIAPNKEAIYGDKLPGAIKRGTIQPIDQFLAMARSIVPVSYPVDMLSDAKKHLDVFDKVDTHWTVLGALIACQHLNGIHWEIHRNPIADFNLNGHSFIRFPSTGDLGSKFVPNVHAERVGLAPGSERGTLEADNGIKNHGNIQVYLNKNGNGKKCLVFGDSFGINLIQILKEYFSIAIFIHSSLIDHSIVMQEKPDLVISEHVERFLIIPPGFSEGFDINKIVDAKRMAENHSSVHV